MIHPSASVASETKVGSASSGAGSPSPLLLPPASASASAREPLVNDVLLSATARLLLAKHPRAAVTASSSQTIREMDESLTAVLAENKRLHKANRSLRHSLELAQARLQFETDQFAAQTAELRARLDAAAEENAVLVKHAAVPRGRLTRAIDVQQRAVVRHSHIRPHVLRRRRRRSHAAQG